MDNNIVTQNWTRRAQQGVIEVLEHMKPIESIPATNALIETIRRANGDQIIIEEMYRTWFEVHDRFGKGWEDWESEE